MARARSYTDDALTEAVRCSRSWRGVLRALGLSATSSSAIRSIRARAKDLGLDTSHFTGQRRWTDDELTLAVRDASSWSDAALRLGLTGGSASTTVKGHAARLGLPARHLREPKERRTPADDQWGQPSTAFISRAGTLLAAAWFTLAGYRVSWPLEPAEYDILVDERRDHVQRIQVKTTTVRAGDTWVARLTRSGMNHATYDPDEIDHFFVIDGELTYYLIPVTAVGGLQAIRLAAYSRYRLDRSPEA